MAAGRRNLRCLIARLPAGKLNLQGNVAELTGGSTTLLTSASSSKLGTEFTADDNGGLWLTIPADDQFQTVTVWYGVHDAKRSNKENDHLSEMRTAVANLASQSIDVDFETIMSGGPRQWRQRVSTQGELGEAVNGYVVDTITVPFANPWGSWMRTTAVDFLSNGAAVVCTLSGDVWVVRWNDKDLSDITWSRFATGLYEPLGLKVIRDQVYVRGRDRITRLHDRNGDGEADYYESFHEGGEIGPSYHAFLFDLQADNAGNLYFAQSGRKSPHEGAVVRVSPDGASSYAVCHDFRHPNGLGVGGPQGWITVSDNPHGKAIYNGVAIVRDGHRYGYSQSRTTPMLAVLPPTVDSSSAGQCWADPKQWGPLSGQMIHTSYSRLCMFYILTQNIGEHPNGFAVRMPFTFQSGLMRTRVHPIDRQVYVVGQKGWDTQARYDGGLYRIRHVDMPTELVVGAEAHTTGIRLTFSCDIDPKSVTMKNIDVIREEEKGTKPVAVDGVRSVGRRSIDVLLPGISKETVAARTHVDKKSGKTTVDVYWPLRITVRLKTPDGRDVQQVVYATINSL